MQLVRLVRKHLFDAGRIVLGLDVEKIGAHLVKRGFGLIFSALVVHFWVDLELLAVTAQRGAVRFDVRLLLLAPVDSLVLVLLLIFHLQVVLRVGVHFVVRGLPDQHVHATALASTRATSEQLTFIAIVAGVLSVGKAAFRIILTDGTETVAGNALRLLREGALLFVVLVFAEHLERVSAVVAGRLTGVAGVRGLARCWVHALVARLHRYLIAAVLVFASLRVVATALAIEDLVAVNLAAA